MSEYRLSQPPQSLRGAKLDNLVLVPANLLPSKAQWQSIANQLPAGDILIILPPTSNPSRKSLESAASQLRAKGQRVTTLLAEKLTPVAYQPRLL